jgi:endonuclease/exonuclease/phosphatase family metal-dependent hydrolase
VKLRVLTLNAGLLRLFAGYLETAPFVDARAAALAAQLRRIDADIVLLQEIYQQRHILELIRQLADLYPWIGYSKRRSFFGLPNSLMALSRRRMVTSIESFRAAPIEEKLFDNKGIQICRLDSDRHAPLTILNIHTTAGGLWLHPESARADRIRDRQIHQFLRLANTIPGTVFLAGDLNAGPGVSESNFQSILDAGFVSVHDYLHPAAADYTWDPSNRLNSGGPHDMCPPQRIDHLLVRKSDIDSGAVQPLRSFVCLGDEVVAAGNNLKYTVSDHLGLCVELQLASG